MQPYAHRIHILQQQLQPSQAFLLTQAADLVYYTDFRPVTHNEREGFLLVTFGSAELFAAAFSPLPEYLEAASQSRAPLDFLTVTRSTSLSRVAVSIVKAKVGELCIDDTGIFLSESKQLQSALTAAHNPQEMQLPLRHIDRKVIWKQRSMKDAHELKHIRKAAEIAKKALSEVLKTLQVGQTEIEVAHQFDVRLFELGAQGPAFPTIVAFGEHATLPHHQPGKTKLTQETPVLIDCGAMVEAYNSDITRTVWFGEKPSEQFLAIKKIVDHAYSIGLEQLELRTLESKTVTAGQVDEAVRKYITDAGYGKEYIHTTGHGIGIDVHEPPSVYQSNAQILEDGMVITIEPGIYVPHQLGYRYENTVLVTSKAPEELTK